MPRPKFEKGNSGRPVGATNKTTRLVKDVFAHVFAKLQSDPKVKLEAWAKNEPTEFYKLASKLIPTQVDATVNQNVNVLSFDPLNKVNDPSNDGTTED